MNNRALLGKLLIIAVIVIILMGTTLYFTFGKNKVGVTAGKVTVSVGYNEEDSDGEVSEGEIEIEEIVDDSTDKIPDEELVEINASEQNLTFENNSGG